MQKEWHPSTLMSKECYTDYTPSFESMMLDLAKQTEKIHGENDLKVCICEVSIQAFKMIEGIHFS